MVQITSILLLISWACYTEVHCTSELRSVDPWWDPRVWPETFVDDDKPFVEFTCGAYLKSKDWLSWRMEKNVIKDQQLSVIQHQGDGYRTLKVLWPLEALKNKSVYCHKRNGTDTKSKSIPITFKKNNYSDISDKDYGPWLWLTKLDDGKRMQFTSYAYLDKLGSLTCYQKKDKSVSKLGMIQQENLYSYVKITLLKTLESSDNGSVVYCTRKELKGGTSSSPDIQITFERQIEALELYVEPSADVVFFDESDVLEFVCGVSESDSDDFCRLTWYLQSPVSRPPDQYFYKSTNENRLSLHMDVFDHEKLLNCAQEFTLELPDGSVSLRELVRSRTITLLHRAQCDTRDRPRAVPATFLDEHKPCIQISCYAYLKPGQLLSWYQSTGLGKSAGSLLRMIQLQDLETKKGEWTVLTLNKTLEPSDNGSEIYCAQQSVRADGSLSDVNHSERIPLTIQRDIPSLERPFIHVEPNNASVSFDVNTTLRLTCRGSKPVDGRTYTWFKIESKSNLTVLKDQIYDASINLNVLYLSLNESHHLNKLYCAQGFLSYIRLTDGSPHVKSYGELVASNITTLIQQDKDEQNLASCSISGDTRLLLLVATPLALFSLAAAAAACCALRRRRAAPPAPPAPAPPAPAPPAPAHGDNTDDIYGDYVNVSRMASPQMTYAVLDLPRSGSAARAPPAPDQALYAEIARVSPQATNATLERPKAARAPPAPELLGLYAEVARVCKRKQ